MSSRWNRQKKRAKRRAKQQGAQSDVQVVNDEPVVAICVPSDDHVHAAFCLSLTQMVLHTLAVADAGLRGLTIQHVGASILPHSRYTLVKQAQRHNSTHMLFIDSDMTFPADTLVRLLRHDKDIVSINALSRRPPHNVTAWIAPGRPVETMPDSTGLEKAWRTGFALVMVKAHVFDALSVPYFNYEFLPEKDEFRGEDYHFFDAAQAAGFELYVDQDLSKQVNHIGSFAYNPMLKHAQQYVRARGDAT